MKKIMFNDRYGLTEAVLEGRKTMTRRIINLDNMPPCPGRSCLYCMDYNRDKGCLWIHRNARYKVGEVVAVAQSYHSLNKSGYVAPEWLDHYCEDSAGYENKMFVRADLMPHQIRITNVRVERLQDISDEDCLREGIVKALGWYRCEGLLERGGQLYFSNPCSAFAALIDKVSGKGTWASNPWVFVYEFELVK